MAERRSGALLIETSKTYGRGLLDGVSRYVHTHRPWSVLIEERGLDDPLPPWLDRWAGDGIDTADVVRAVRMHRASLKRRFEKVLGRSPKAEIMRLQLDRVRQLLCETDFTLKRIADLTGFRHAEYMSVLFKRKEGKTPGEYRKEAERRGG